MDTTTITNIILTALPFLVALAAWLYRIGEQRLPSNTRAMLDHFAEMAVQSIEQQYAGKLGPDKKQLASQAIEEFFSAFRLPDPGATAINAAIESAVFLLNQSKSQALAPAWNATSAKPPQPIVPTDGPQVF